MEEDTQRLVRRGCIEGEFTFCVIQPYSAAILCGVNIRDGHGGHASVRIERDGIILSNDDFIGPVVPVIVDDCHREQDEKDGNCILQCWSFIFRRIGKDRHQKDYIQSYR